MSVSNVIRRLALGAAFAGGLAGFAAQALAEDAVTTAAINMRSGPGTAYPVIMRLPEGVGVDYVGRGCAGSWCNVMYDGERGWVNAAYLEEVEERRPLPLELPQPERGQPVGVDVLGSALQLGERGDRLAALGRTVVVDLQQQGLVALHDQGSAGHRRSLRRK